MSAVSIQSLLGRFTTRQRKRIALVSALAMMLALLPGILNDSPVAEAAHAFSSVDEEGANDEPGQKDLTYLEGTEVVDGKFTVIWNWDETNWSGQNTGDACALFDSDADGNINYALCVTVGGNGNQLDTRLYSCGDDKPDRCTQPVVELPDFDSTCTVTANAVADPFDSGAPNGPGDEWPLDTVATCEVDLDDIPEAEFINACSYPSEQPNSDPSDCVLIPASLSTELLKVADPTEVPETGGLVTFSVTVNNTSSADATVISLVDSIYGDLDSDPAPVTPDWETSTCDVPAPLPSGGSYACSFTAFVEGDYPDSETDTVTSISVDDGGNQNEASGSATVTFTDVPPDISVDKSANPTSVFEPGGDVTYTVTLTNNTAEDLTVTSLIDDQFGDVGADCKDAGNVLLVGQTLPGDGSLSCTFVGAVAGEGNTTHTNVVTGKATDDEGTADTDTGTAVVDILDFVPGPGALKVTKTANPTEVPENGGDVTFTVVLKNTHFEGLEVVSLIDTIYGDIGATCLDADDLSLVGQTIVALVGTLTCTFTEFVSGDYPGSETDVVTGKAKDNEGNMVTDDDDATVTFTDVPSSIDVTKTADPTELNEPGGAVTYTVTIKNTSLADSVTIDKIHDTKFGIIAGPGATFPAADTDCDDLINDVLAPDDGDAAGLDETSCTFSVTLSGQNAGSHVNKVTVEGTDDDDAPVSDYDEETVTIRNVAPSIVVTKTADPTFVMLPGGDVTYTVTIKNTSASTDPVMVTSFLDSIEGEAGFVPAGLACERADTTPFNLAADWIAPGETITCTFTRFVSGDAGESETDRVTVVVKDDDDPAGTASDYDDAIVSILWNGCTPGFWKTHAGEPWSPGNQANSWLGAYQPGDLLNDVFAIPGGLEASLKGGSDKRSTGIGAGDTLWDALNYRGGNERRGAANILLRAAVAGLLNEAYYGETYPAYDTTDDLIAAVNAALAITDPAEGRHAMLELAGTLDYWNNGECDLP